MPRELASFVDYLKIEKGLAPLTVVAYTRDITQFADFLKKRPLTAARRQDVRDFLDHLFSHHVDGRSVARKLSALRHFYKYLLLDRHIAHDPTLNLETPRQWKVLPKALARDEIATMLAPRSATTTKLATAITLRDRAMLETFYAGGLRVSEIVGVKLEDLKLDLGYVLVRGKGDKERIVPLGMPAIQAIREYLAEGREALAKGKSSPLVFIGRGARKITPPVGLEDRACRIFGQWPPRQPAHAAPQLRHAHGRVRRRPAHGADHPRTRRHLDHPGLHAPGSRPAEERLSRAPSASEKLATETRRHRVGPVPKAVARFLRSLRERNASAHTIKAYTGDLEKFAVYVGDSGWKQIDHVRIRGFLSRLYDQGLSKTSVARALAAVRSLYRWLAREGVVEQNPAALVATPRLPKKLPRVPTIEEMNTVLDGDMPELAAWPERDRLILELLYGCGIRNSELIGINLDDVRWSGEAILVRGKGRKERYVPFGDAVKSALTAYLSDTAAEAGRAQAVHARSARQPARDAPHYAQRWTDRQANRGRQGALTRGSPAHSASRLRHASS